MYRKIRSKYNQQYQDNAGGVGLPTLARDSEDEEDSEEEEEGQRARPVNVRVFCAFMWC